jgi:hypothetical protein
MSNIVIVDEFDEPSCPEWCYNWNIDSSIFVWKSKKDWLNKKKKISTYEICELKELEKLIDEERKRVEFHQQNIKVIEAKINDSKEKNCYYNDTDFSNIEKKFKTLTDEEIESIYVDDLFICEAFENLEDKELSEIRHILEHFESLKKILSRYREIDPFTMKSYFKNTNERQAIKTSVFENNEEKGIKFMYTLKKYYLLIKENLEDAREIYKQKQIANKDVRKEKKKLCGLKIKTCECGCEVSSSNYATHLKSVKHLKYLENK